MSISYDAVSMFGCKIKNPYVAIKERGCIHFIQRSDKFCSQCGAAAWISFKELHPILHHLREENDIDNFEVVCIEKYDDIYVGVCYNSTDSIVFFEGKKINIEDMKKKLKKVLGELYDDENFGLWTILTCC